MPLDDALAMRRAGRDLLSLALIDARNHLLALLALDESPPALQLAARAGCYQESWIARHVQRQRGEACDPRSTRLAGIEALAEAWAGGDATPAPQALRGYLAESLEITLDLLASAAEDDASLHYYRLSLLHEDRLCEALAERLLAGAPPARAVRDPIWLPAQRWMLGSTAGGQAQEASPLRGEMQDGSPRRGEMQIGNPLRGEMQDGSPLRGEIQDRSPLRGKMQHGSPLRGLVPHNERWAHEVAVPETEIDAQPVNWGQYVEFAEDRGYERAELWSDAGWAWLQAGGRRAPGNVEQLQGGVLVQRRGGLQRAPALQPVMHANRHEAEAWCRWAGRRLPTEPEWELAACTAASRGFAWGDIFEWVAGSARAWPGAGEPSPGALDTVPPAGTQGVLRGASFATRARWRHPKARRFAAPAHDTMFCGFRSCAL